MNWFTTSSLSGAPLKWCWCCCGGCCCPGNRRSPASSALQCFLKRPRVFHNDVICFVYSASHFFGLHLRNINMFYYIDCVHCEYLIKSTHRWNDRAIWPTLSFFITKWNRYILTFHIFIYSQNLWMGNLHEMFAYSVYYAVKQTQGTSVQKTNKNPKSNIGKCNKK